MKKQDLEIIVYFSFFIKETNMYLTLTLEGIDKLLRFYDVRIPEKVEKEIFQEMKSIFSLYLNFENAHLNFDKNFWFEFKLSFFEDIDNLKQSILADLRIILDRLENNIKLFHKLQKKNVAFSEIISLRKINQNIEGD